jgi:hypothetical protein
MLLRRDWSRATTAEGAIVFTRPESDQ